MRGKHRYRRRRRRWIPGEWRRPLAALAILCAGVLLVVVGLLVDEFLVVWAIFALCALIGGLVLLSGDSGPEWPDWPVPEHRLGEGSRETQPRSGDAWNGARAPDHADRRAPAR